MIRFSIITINYNNAIGLEKTIQSVISQNYSALEYILIDGNSSDGSKEILKKYESTVNHIVSEKDKGIYDAQNKGIKIATGDFLVFLNSGDCFTNNNVLKNVAESIANKNIKIAYGNTQLINRDGNITSLVPPDELNLNFWYMNTLNHQAVFAHQSLFNEIGNFSINFRYASDFEFLFKAFKKHPSHFFHMDFFVCNYDNSGITSNKEIEDLIISERIKILKSNTSFFEYIKMRNYYFKSISNKKKISFLMRHNWILKYSLKPIRELFRKNN